MFINGAHLTIRVSTSIKQQDNQGEPKARYQLAVITLRACKFTHAARVDARAPLSSVIRQRRVSNDHMPGSEAEIAPGRQPAHERSLRKRNPVLACVSQTESPFLSHAPFSNRFSIVSRAYASDVSIRGCAGKRSTSLLVHTEENPDRVQTEDEDRLCALTVTSETQRQSCISSPKAPKIQQHTFQSNPEKLIADLLAANKQYCRITTKYQADVFY
ncbi:hypothetical protein Q7C36_010716 [Tachysurus vachellii]|uniref:Uncharacterized protein n=1 Tax=Tachysurus vachellii TaxID=175792 RepID=A0AA88MV74_TACVA|nr:hypothetical protein Q7C36_010716 [Tachysurus vachellii]